MPDWQSGRWTLDAFESQHESRTPHRTHPVHTSEENRHRTDAMTDAMTETR